MISVLVGWWRKNILNQEWTWVCPKCRKDGFDSSIDLAKVIRTLDKNGKPHHPESYYRKWENRCHKHTRTRVEWGWR